MPEYSQYAAANNVPLIKSPSLRLPRPVEMPPDLHPLPEDVIAYFVYPFTLEPHVLTMESSRRSTLAAQSARHEAYLKQREEDKRRRKREALRRIAPGFEPESGPLVPTRMSTAGMLGGAAASNAFGETGAEGGGGGATTTTASTTAAPGGMHVRTRSVMDDLVDHLAALDAVSSSNSSTGTA
ncbi:hypothetical protein SCHPADRAFT_892648 [Schizopora paradoxa]|uniref:Uncharacterized protein n=1 Tax=Schizopora paradoxa TaxID=27342 RepID=A0A0H2RZ70_9AGAM|nr:hypothetical protein SCHPADRAFT_892648 [Schizopora paradoxa]